MWECVITIIIYHVGGACFYYFGHNFRIRAAEERNRELNHQELVYGRWNSVAMDNAGTNPSRVLQYSIDARPEPRSSPFDCGHNFRIGAGRERNGWWTLIIKTR